MVSDVRSVVDDPLIVGKTVFKVGRTTGKTAGIVRHISATVEVRSDPTDPTSPLVDALELIQIISIRRRQLIKRTVCTMRGSPSMATPARSSWTTNAGRLGSTRLARRPRPTACRHRGRIRGGDVTSVPVLDQLGVCIPTSGGTSHGSCAAIDGSGTAVTAPGTPHARTTGGSPRFASHGAVARTPRPSDSRI